MMKKLFLVVLTFMLALSISSCRSQDLTSSLNENSGKESEEIEVNSPDEEDSQKDTSSIPQTDKEDDINSDWTLIY